MKLLFFFIIIFSFEALCQKPFNLLWDYPSDIRQKYGLPNKVDKPYWEIGGGEEWTYYRVPDKDATTTFYISKVANTVNAITIKWKAPLKKINHLWEAHYSSYKVNYEFLSENPDSSAKFIIRSRSTIGMSRELYLERKEDELEITISESYD